MTARVRVHYPLASGRLVLRTDRNWDENLEPVDRGVSQFDFDIRSDAPFAYFKPVLVDNGVTRWSEGNNYLALTASNTPREIYPYFDASHRCSVCEVRTLDSVDGRHDYRVFYPPGYHENVLKRYPVLYMHDAQNLFFREEAFRGQHWRIQETLWLLDSMNLVDKVIVVGIYPNQRQDNYTKPGYERYGRFVAESLKPELDREFRTLPDPSNTAVMGSSLGGVVTLFMAWQWPHVFGMCAAMSGTFGWRDDLRERITDEPKRAIRIYLDSGWPRDNYETTRNMRALLKHKGYVEGRDLFYLGFPEALHDETHWAMRCHIPFQFLFRRRR